MNFPNLTRPSYIPDPDPALGINNVFSDMVHSYLNNVQTNPFPPPLAIGVLYFVLMPLIGMFFCCCRCCGNCGGKMYQKQTKNTLCKRRTIYMFLLVTTLIILAGNICMFYSNSKISSGVNDGISSFNSTIKNVNTYINSVSQEVDFVIGQSDPVINSANSSISGIGTELGGMIQTEIQKVANPILDLVVQTVTGLNDTANALQIVNNSFNSLIEEQKIIQANLSSLQNSINNTLIKCGAKCSSAQSSVDSLVFDVSYQIPDFSDQGKKINDFLNSGVDSTLQKARKVITDIPDTVYNQTIKTVQDVQKELNNIRSSINDTKNSIPVASTLSSVSSSLNNFSSSADQYFPDVKKYDYYRWIVGLILSCFFLFLIVCILFGMTCGPLGLKGNEDPTERNCASNSGGDFFMASVGFSFIFSWLLILIVVILFLVGGHGYTLICRPWANHQLIEYVDSLHIPELNLSRYIENVTINISTLYSDCQNDNALWTTLSLDNTYNLDQTLNITQYTDKVRNTIDNTNITINNINFLDSNQKNQISTVSNSGIDTLNFTAFRSQLNRNITKVNLLAFADQLNTLASDSSLASNVISELKQEATSLQQVDNQINTKLIPAVQSLNISILNLESKSKVLPATLNNTLQKINDAQLFVDTQATSLIKNTTLVYVNKILGLFQSYVDWAKNMLRTNVARCGPIASAVNSAYVVACVYVVESLNAFWFSMGWCTIFLIPGIILSVKLAKYYRRMKTSDIYE
ncbi:hypothetical protein GDO86_013376 [Hymenochirus boettgeri]|uniref:Uncharacterized protein n=1 Tax=Hymenochirus boettgeri TaxID=247094 RepID=A0A8T2IWH4_9PIPI|nr:hypothetical protein GDO86_013376 [Hymenochirus boettgeri]